MPSPDTITPRQYARELAESAAPERKRLEVERLSVEFSQPIVQGYRRKKRRQAAELPLFDPKQEGLF
jgi:hypothetical protein